jgi:hypothetical protein
VKLRWTARARDDLKEIHILTVFEGHRLLNLKAEKSQDSDQQSE